MSVVVYIAVSLDGFIADSQGGVGWLAPFEANDYGYEDFVAGVDHLVMGRTTYDQVRSFGMWPYDGKRVVVMTTRPLEENAPQGVTSWRGDDMTALADLPGTTWLVGGTGAIRPFLAASLVDRMRLFVMPVLLGDGIRLFDGHAAMPLRLHANHRHADGVVELDYWRL